MAMIFMLVAMIFIVGYKIQCVWIVYLVQLLMHLFLVCRIKDLCLTKLLSPCFLSLLYLSLNFLFGSMFVLNDIAIGSGLGLLDKIHAVTISNLQIANSFFILCNGIVFDVWLRGLKWRSFKNTHVFDVREFKKGRLFVFSLFILLFCAIVPIDLSMFGGAVADGTGAAENFNYYYRVVTIIFLSVGFFYTKERRVRYLFYLLMILYLVLTSFSSKREILFVVIFFLFIESLKQKLVLKVSIKNIAYLFIVSILAIWIILVSSVLRGYGNYDIKSPLDAFKSVNKYIQEDYFLEAATANFEVNSAYGHSMMCVDYVLNENIPLQYGKTFIKVLFIPFPRQMFPEKPNAMIDIYTRTYDPLFRSLGGSYPVCIYSEMFANFLFLAPFFVLLFFILFESMYYRILEQMDSRKSLFKLISLLMIYTLFISAVRGGGLESLVIPYIITLPVLLFLLLFCRKRPNQKLYVSRYLKIYR